MCRSFLAEKRRLGKGQHTEAEGFNSKVPAGDRRAAKLAQRLCAGRRRGGDQRGEVKCSRSVVSDSLRPHGL